MTEPTKDEPRSDLEPTEGSTPGTLKKRTLYALIETIKAKPTIALPSLKDRELIDLFIPQFEGLEEILKETEEEGKVDQEFINNAADFVYESSKDWTSRLPKLTADQIKEVQRAILWHKANELRLRAGKEPTRKFGLSTFFESAKTGKLVKIGDGFAPIPDFESQAVVSSMIDKKPLPMLSPNQREVVAKNIEVVNTLAGTSLSLL